MCPGETPSDFRGAEASTAGSVPRCAGGVSLQSPSVTAAFRVALVTGTTKSQLPLWEYPAGAGGTSQEGCFSFLPCATLLSHSPGAEATAGARAVHGTACAGSTPGAEAPTRSSSLLGVGTACLGLAVCGRQPWRDAARV